MARVPRVRQMKILRSSRMAAKRILPSAVLTAAVLVTAFIGSATALEPPWPGEKLAEESEAIVEGIVLAVELEGIEGEDPEAFRLYRAWLDVEGITKGEVDAEGTVEIAFRRLIARPDTPVGIGADAVYRPGERVRAYLRWSASERAWTTIHWSGKQTLDVAAAELPLPETVGASAIAVDSDEHRPGCEARGGSWSPLSRGDQTRVCVLPPSAGEAPEDTRCDALEGYACVTSQRCTWMGQMQRYQCVEARDSCEQGWAQESGREACATRPGCTFVPAGPCYCPPAGSGQVIACLCSGGRPPQCRQADG